MIRRALLALLIGWTCATATLPCDARGLMVYDKGCNPANEGDERCQSVLELQRMVAGAIQRWGGDVDRVPCHVARTEYCRIGVMTLGSGAGAYTRSYAAVIHVAYSSGASRAAAGYRPDSLTLAAKPPLVPQLYIATDGDFSNSASCSTGVAVPLGAPGGVASVRYLKSNPALKYQSGNDETVPLSSAALTSRGYRVLIGSSTSAAATEAQWPTVPWPCVNCDSAAFAASDTCQVWAKLNSNINGASPCVFVEPSHFTAQSADPIPMLGALAWVDSLTKHALFPDSTFKPIRIAIRISGGWRRNARTVAGGISPDDSTALIASIDSLASLGVPFSVGVNMDSLGAYPSDKTWWARAGKAHYSPENWDGISDSTKSGAFSGSVGATWQLPVDPLGRFRARIFRGDGSGAGRDTSLETLVRANFWRCDSTFRGLTDHALFAADDDWVPLGMRTYSGWRPDSLVSSLADAGVRVLVVNTRDNRSEPWFAPHNPKALGIAERWIATPYSAKGVTRLPIVGTAGSADSGSAIFDRGGSLAGAGGQKHYRYVESLWRGVLMGGTRASYSGDENGNGGGYAVVGDSLDSGAHILTIHAADLGSGTRADAATLPTRPGWWQIKNLVNGARIVNALAGRTMIDIVYPEQVEP